MKRPPAAHRLATRKERAERRWVRQTRRNYRPRWITGISEGDLEGYAERMRELGETQIWHVPEPTFRWPMPAEYRRFVDAAERMPTYSEMFHRTKGA